MRRKSIIAFLCSLVLCAPLTVQAYGVATHSALTLEGAKLYNLRAERPLNEVEMGYLARGAKEEDETPRFMNHFYDPSTGKGVTLFGRTWVSALQWASDPAEQLAVLYNWERMAAAASGLALVMRPSQLSASDFTWERALSDYASGNEERGLVGLGHILHLIEDMTVPAHTRGDAHPPTALFGKEVGDDDPYETWTEQFIPGTVALSDALKSAAIPRKGSIAEYIKTIALATHRSYYSKDSVYSYDEPLRSVVRREEYAGRVYQWAAGEQGEYLVGVELPTVLGDDSLPVVTTDSVRVVRENWQQLSRQAVLHVAGAIDLFFRQVDDLKQSSAGSANEDISPVAKALRAAYATGRQAAGATSKVFASAYQSMRSVFADPVATGAEMPAEQKNIESAEPSAPTNEVVTQTAFAPSAQTYSPVSESKQEERVAVVATVAVNAPSPSTQPAPAMQATRAISIPTTSVGFGGTLANRPPPVLDPPPALALNVSLEEGAVSVESSAPVAASSTQEVASSTPIEVAVEGGLATSTEEVVPVVELRIPQLLMSEVAVDMEGADTREFVELYNPTNEAVSLAGWSLQYLGPSATTSAAVVKKHFSEAAVVPAKGFYLVGLGGYTGAPAADMSWSQSLANTGGTLILARTTEVALQLPELQSDSLSYGSTAFTDAAEALPSIGSSLERGVVGAVGCSEAIDALEFSGNTCTAGDRRWWQRMTPKPQSALNLPEPRRAPSWELSAIVFASYDASKPSPQFTPQITFSWPAATDAVGGVVSYDLQQHVESATTTLLSSTTTRSFAKNISVIGTSYDYVLTATDRDGLAASVRQELRVPGYFTGVRWYKDGGAKSANGSDRYLLELAYDRYPFVPISFGNAAGWHMMLPSYNTPAESVPFFDSSMNGRIWGSFGNAAGVRVQYPSCSGNPNQSIVFPDTEAQCSTLAGGAIGLAFDWQQLAAENLRRADIEVWGSSFGVPPIAGKDYLTFSFYGSPLLSNSGMKFIARDATKYFVGTSPTQE